MEPAPLPPPDPAPSLTQRMGDWRRRTPDATEKPPQSKRAGWMLALMLPLGPLLTLGVAEWLAAREASAIAAMEATPRAKAWDAAWREAEMLRRLMRAGGFAAVLERAARVLPEQDRLVSAAVGQDDEGRGELKLEVATADPDRLRAAFARDPAFVRLRGEGERRGDGVLIVTLAGTP